jgi:hypothetical protein
VEAKELYNFPGCSLDRNESFVGESCTNAEMLENLSTAEAGGRLRKCHVVAGEGAKGTCCDRDRPEGARDLAGAFWS